MKNTNKQIDNSEVRAEQVTNAKYEAIYLGADLHKESISVTRIIDHGTPQPAQRLSWEGFWRELLYRRINKYLNKKKNIKERKRLTDRPSHRSAPYSGAFDYV
jgi:hypothetical protein